MKGGDASMVEPSRVKVPLMGAAAGLLLGILLTLFLGVETAGGTALLIIICTPTVIIISLILEALLRRRK